MSDKIPDPSFDYDHGGQAYAGVRQADPRFARRIHAALGDARTVLNVGAGYDRDRGSDSLR